jgi:hypothetical protein
LLLQGESIPLEIWLGNYDELRFICSPSPKGPYIRQNVFYSNSYVLHDLGFFKKGTLRASAAFVGKAEKLSLDVRFAWHPEHFTGPDNDDSWQAGSIILPLFANYASRCVMVDQPRVESRLPARATLNQADVDASLEVDEDEDEIDLRPRHAIRRWLDGEKEAMLEELEEDEHPQEAGSSGKRQEKVKGKGKLTDDWAYTPQNERLFRYREKLRREKEAAARRRQRERAVSRDLGA